MVHPHPQWNDEEDDTNDENEAMADDEDLVDDDEHDIYLDRVPLEEEDRLCDSDIREITSESNMDDQVRMTVYIRLIVLTLHVFRLINPFCCKMHVIG